MTAPTRPRLLVLSSTFPRWQDDAEPGFVFELARRLTDRFDVTVLAPHAPGSLTQEVMDAVRVVRFRYAPTRLEQLATYGGGILSRIKANRLNGLLVPPFVIGALWALIQLLRRERFSVIHAHWVIPQGAFALAAMALARRRIPLVCTSHGGDLYGLRGKIFGSVMRTVIRSSHHITVVSGALRERALTLGADLTRVSVLPMGVDLRHRFALDQATTRSSHELLFVGRLVEKKGLDILLEAMQLVAKQNPQIRLTVVGDGPLREAHESQASALGLSDRVSFLGMTPQQHLPALYQRATVLVVPFVVASGGDQEGLGLVSIEAMGCGCPVIASDLPAVRDVIRDRETGILVPTRNPKSLADAINALMMDPEKRARLASAAHGDVLARFDWSSIAARYGPLLDSVSSKPQAPQVIVVR